LLDFKRKFTRNDILVLSPRVKLFEATAENNFVSRGMI